MAFSHFASQPFMRRTTVLAGGASVQSGRLDGRGYDKIRVFVFADQAGEVRISESGGSSTMRQTAATAFAASTATVIEWPRSGQYVTVTLVNTAGAAQTVLDFRAEFWRQPQ